MKRRVPSILVCRLLQWVAAGLGVLGCAAYKPPPTVPPQSAETFPLHLVIGVVELLPEIARQGAAEMDTYSAKLDAERLIEALRGTNLFDEVGLTRDLSRRPDILFAAHPDPHSNLQLNETMLASVFLSLGALPAYGTGSRSLYFTSACGPDVSFEFPFLYDEFGGWFSFFLLPTSAWHWSLSKKRDSYYFDQVSIYLRNHAGEFTALSKACRQ
jgi:hypothetical protein